VNVFVTGATGFVGRQLCARLTALGHQVTGVGRGDCDLTVAGALEARPHPSYQHIYHLAAWTQAGDFCLRHPAEQWEINQKINTHVLSWWMAGQRQAKLISIGPSCCYDPSLPLSEDQYLRGTPEASLLTYALTKRMLHAGLLAAGRQYGLRHLTVVPSTLYGPGYPLSTGKQLHFIYDLVRKILRGQRFGEPVVLWGDGEQRRELVYVDDFVEALIGLANAVDDELVNVGAGQDHSIREFAAAICAQTGFPAEQIQYDGTAYVGVRTRHLEISKLERLLPRPPALPLVEGLRRTIDWVSGQL